MKKKAFGKHCGTRAANCRNICPSYPNLQMKSIKNNKGQ